MGRLSKLNRSIKGKVALVTGAASGMGRATAHLFADEGAKVAVTDLHAGDVKKVVDEIEESGGTAKGWVLDVTSEKDRTRVLKELEENWAGLDILVNNAGIAVETTIDNDGYQEIWDRTLAVLLTSQSMLIKTCLPLLKKAPDARIVNIASTEGLGATKGISPYTAAKTGVIGLTRSLAVDMSRPDSYGDDRCYPRRGEGRIRETSCSFETICGTRRGSSRDLEFRFTSISVHHRNSPGGGWRFNNKKRLVKVWIQFA